MVHNKINSKNMIKNLKSFLNIIFLNKSFLKMSKDLSAKYYQKKKERLQKKTCERYQDLFEEEKLKMKNMVVSNIKISLKMKNKD